MHSLAFSIQPPAVDFTEGRIRRKADQREETPPFSQSVSLGPSPCWASDNLSDNRFRTLGPQPSIYHPPTLLSSLPHPLRNMETTNPRRSLSRAPSVENEPASPINLRHHIPHSLGRVLIPTDPRYTNHDANQTLTESESSSEEDDAAGRQTTADDENAHESDEVMDIEEADHYRRMLAAADKGPQAVEKAMKAEEKRQRELERQKELLKVPAPLEIGDQESFLGYALVDIVVPHDGGKGPDLQPSPYCRPRSTKQLTKIKEAAGADGSGLRTRDFEHAVIIAVPRAVLDETHLTHSPYGPHRRVRWTDEAVKSTMVLLAGSHRQQVAQDLTLPHQKEILRLEVKLDKATSRHQLAKKKALEDKIANIRKAIEPRVVWLAMLYDKDRIFDFHQQNGTALLKLITNNRIPPSQNSEAHDLSCIFRLAYDAGRETTEALLKYIKTLNQHRGESYRRLAQRGGGFLLFLIKLRASKYFNHFLTESAKILSVQHEIWGLIGPAVEFMWLQVLYPCSDIPLPNGYDGEISEPFRQRLVKAIRSRDSTTYLSRVVLDVLVDLADKAFNEHLSIEILHVGTKSPEYWQAYTDYAKEVVGGFREALRESRSHHPELWTDKDVAVAEQAHAKLCLILLKQAACRAQGSPILDSSLPLFTPMCGASMLDDWLSVKDILYMISTWFTPNLSHIQTLNVGATQKMPISSYPEAIRLYLETWLGYKVHRDWSRMDRNMMLRHMFDQRLRGDQIVCNVFNIIVRVLWRHRESILRPAQKVLPHLPRIKSATVRSIIGREDPEFHAALSDEGVEWIKLWLKDLSKRTKVWQQDVTPRLDPTLPPTIRELIEKWEAEHGESRMLPIFNALQSSLFNFLVSPTGPSNNKSHHTKQILYLADELLFYQHELIPALRIVTPVANLYHEIVNIIHSCPELHNSPFWLDIPEAPDAPDRVDETLYTNQLVRKDRIERWDIFHNALQHFVRRISKADCLGIMMNPLEEPTDKDEDSDPASYRLHLTFDPDLQSICRRARIITHHLATINNSTKLVEWPVVEDRWFELERTEGSTSDHTVPLPICTLDDLLLHYQDQQVRQIDRNRGNTSINEQALDEHFGLLYQDDEDEEGSEDDEEGEVESEDDDQGQGGYEGEADEEDGDADDEVGGGLSDEGRPAKKRRIIEDEYDE